MQQVDDTTDNELFASFSIYYGLEDSRNYTEKITIKKNQNLDHVYAMVNIYIHA
jgi:hypothetical protein